MVACGALCIISASYWWHYWSDTFGDDDLVDHIKTCAIDCKLGLSGGLVALICGVLVLVFSNLVPFCCNGCYDGTAEQIPLTRIQMTGWGNGQKAKRWPPASPV